MRVLNSRKLLVAGLLLELLPMLMVVEGFLVLPRPLSTFRPTATRNIVGPLSVSKKEKLRLREEEERLKALEEAQQRIAQKELARNIRKGDAPIKKLLRNALHDGLLDFGEEVRLLVLEKFNASEKYEDMLDFLDDEPSNANANANAKVNTNMNMYGLIAHAKLGKWDTAAQFADTFYDSNHNLLVALGDVLSKEQQEQIRKLSIQAIANADHNLDQALELYDPGTDPPLVLNALLKCMITKRDKPKEARQLFLRAKNTNQESFRLALSAAAKLGDVPLMQQAIDQLQSPSTCDNLLALETLCFSRDTSWSCQNQTFAIETIRNSTNTATKNIKNINLPPELFSKLITRLENSSDIKEIFLVSKRLHGGRKNWLDSLSSEARVRVLLTLEAESEARKKLLTIQGTASSFGNDTDAMNILESLITISKQGDVVLKSSLPKHVHPSEFWSASLRLTAPDSDRPDMESIASSIDEKYGAMMDTNPLTFVAKLYPIYQLASQTRRLQLMVDLLGQVLSLVRPEGLSAKTAKTETASVVDEGQDAELEFLVSSFKDIMRMLASQPALGDYKIVAREAFRSFFYLDYALVPKRKFDGKASVEGINSVFDLILESKLFEDTELVALASDHFFALYHVTYPPTKVFFPVQEVEDKKANANPPVLQCLIERAIACDNKFGTDWYSFVLDFYREYLEDNTLLSWSILDGSLRDALRFGMRAAGTDTWYRDLWNTDTARTVFQDGIAEDVIHIVGSNYINMWKFMQGMDDMREVFDKLDLGAEYAVACRRNIRIIVDFMFGSLVHVARAMVKNLDVLKTIPKQHRNDYEELTTWLTTAVSVLGLVGETESSLSDDLMYDVMTALFDHTMARKHDRLQLYDVFFDAKKKDEVLNGISPVIHGYYNSSYDRYHAAVAENPTRPNLSNVFIRKSTQ